MSGPALFLVFVVCFGWPLLLPAVIGTTLSLDTEAVFTFWYCVATPVALILVVRWGRREEKYRGDANRKYIDCVKEYKKMYNCIVDEWLPVPHDEIWKAHFLEIIDGFPTEEEMTCRWRDFVAFNLADSHAKYQAHAPNLLFLDISCEEWVERNEDMWIRSQMHILYPKYTAIVSCWIPTFEQIVAWADRGIPRYTSKSLAIRVINGYDLYTFNLALKDIIEKTAYELSVCEAKAEYNARFGTRYKNTERQE